MRWADGSYLEDQDFWRLSGFDRGVKVYTVDDVRIADMFVISDLDEDYKRGLYTSTVTIENGRSQQFNGSVELQLIDKEGRVLIKESKQLVVEAGSTVDVAIERGLAKVDLWSHEFPNLYTTLVALRGSDGAVIEATSTRTGFRKVEIKDAQLLLNGRRLMIKAGRSLQSRPHCFSV